MKTNKMTKNLTRILLAGTLAFNACSGVDDSRRGLIYAGNIDGYMVAYNHLKYGDAPVSLASWTIYPYSLEMIGPDGSRYSFYDKDTSGVADIIPRNMDRDKADELYKRITYKMKQELK